MRRSSIGVGVVVGLLLGASVWAQDPADPRVTIPVKGLDEARGRTLSDELSKLSTLDSASVSLGSPGWMALWPGKGKRVSLSDLRKAVAASSTPESPLGMEEGAIVLTGTFQVVTLTDPEEDLGYLEGLLGGYLEASGKVVVTRLEAGDLKAGEKGTTSLFQVDFTPNEGEKVTLGDYREGSKAGLLSPGDEYGIADVRWVGPPPAEKK